MSPENPHRSGPAPLAKRRRLRQHGKRAPRTEEDAFEFSKAARLTAGLPNLILALTAPRTEGKRSAGRRTWRSGGPSHEAAILDHAFRPTTSSRALTVHANYDSRTTFQARCSVVL